MMAKSMICAVLSTWLKRCFIVVNELVILINSQYFGANIGVNRVFCVVRVLREVVSTDWNCVMIRGADWKKVQRKMDYDALDRSLTELEGILGINEFSNTKPVAVEIDQLNKKLRNEYGATLLYSIPTKKLETLNKIATETSNLSGNLAERVESIKFSENLINHRIALVKQFEECLENVLDTSTFSKVSELQPQLEEEIRVCEELSEKWSKERQDFMQFRREYSGILQQISSRILDLEKKIEYHNEKKNQIE